VNAFAVRDADQLLGTVDRMFERSVNIESALDDLLLKLHDLGLHRVAPQIVESKSDDVEELRKLSAALPAEDIQLYYQIGLLGKRDLAQAPTPRIGLEMVLLRMLAFHPDDASSSSASDLSPDSSGTAQKTPPAYAIKPTEQRTESAQDKPQHVALDIQTHADWLEFVRASKQLSGMAKQFAQQVVLESRDGDKIVLVAPLDAKQSLMRDENQRTLKQILTELTGQNIELDVRKGASEQLSLAAHNDRLHQESVKAALQQLEQEDIPKMLRQEFDAKPDSDSIRLPEAKSGQSIS